MPAPTPPRAWPISSWKPAPSPTEVFRGFMKLPSEIGAIHFIGIGGIGMSGIAEVLVNQGYAVQGSDVAENANVRRLREKGVKVALGHAAGNLGDASVVVVSSAIRRDNPEL